MKQMAKKGKGRKALFLVPSSLDDLKEKGVEYMIEYRDEFGFFEHVWTVHPLAGCSRTVRLAERHTIIEFGGRFRGLRQPLKMAYYALTVLDCLSTCYRLIRREGIIMIRAQDPHVMGLMGLILERLTGVPCCISIHANYDTLQELAK